VISGTGVRTPWGREAGRCGKGGRTVSGSAEGEESPILFFLAGRKRVEGSGEVQRKG
jgi:hypothetical protein